MTDKPLYPLAVGNSWTYRLKDGRQFTNQITDLQADVFYLSDTFTKQTAMMKRSGNDYLTHRMEFGQWVTVLKDDLKVGDTWQYAFIANGVNTTLVHVVKGIGLTKKVEGNFFTEVVCIEAESKMSMNGRAIPMQFFTQYYYARNVGLILTTTSSGDSMPLVAYELK